MGYSTCTMDVLWVMVHELWTIVHTMDELWAIVRVLWMYYGL